MSNGNGSPQAEPKIGRTLELARKERGLSLDQVEQETKIRARYLEELERENFDVLPPVYVQGSLKTYANFLGLDGEELARELKRRQPLEDEPEAPTHVEPPKSDYFDRYLVSLGGAAGAENREIAGDEEMAGTAPVPADNRRLLVGSAAFLVLILVAIALALTLPRDGQPELSQLREPMTSQAPEVSRASSEESEQAQSLPQEDGQQSSGDEGDSSQPEQNAGPPAEEDEGGVTTEQAGQADPSPAQNPRDATADRQAPATAEPETAPSTEPPPTTAPPPSTPAEAPIDDDAPGVRADDPVGQDDETVVMNAGGLRVSSGDGDSVEIRRGKGIKIRASGDGADDKDKDRR
ncbi:MAG: helix-turn-helix domain-containing protein [Actinobacteria bacterium]|nr:helix-turn-helix domain-containing protein [Actinomycetota bacterium]